MSSRHVDAGRFLNLARQVFDMIDTDYSGTLDRDEIVNAALRPSGISTCPDFATCFKRTPPAFQRGKN